MSFISKYTGNIVPVNAHFCGWEGLSNLCAALLIGYFNRPISVEARRDPYEEGWSLWLNKPLLEEELAALRLSLHFETLEQAGTRLRQAVGERLVDAVLPFTVTASHTTRQGVWFTGSGNADTVRLLIEYPEADCRPDMLMVPLRDGITEETVINAFRTAMRFEQAEVRAEFDRLTRLDMMIGDMKLELGVEITAVTLDAVGCIN